MPKLDCYPLLYCCTFDGHRGLCLRHFFSFAFLSFYMYSVRILGELAYHGHRVKMYDANIDALNSAYQRIEEDKQHLQQDGLLQQLNFIVCVTFYFVSGIFCQLLSIRLKFMFSLFHFRV